MQFMLNLLNSVADSETAVLLAIFIVASLLGLIMFLAIVPMLETRRRLRSLTGSHTPLSTADPAGDKLNRELQSYYDTFLAGDKNSLKTRLIQAGYFGPSAIYAYNLIRFGTALALFVVAFILIDRFAREASPLMVFLFAGFFGTLGIILPNFILDAMARNRREQYRRTFPDFVDMLVVCADAGLSIEASAQRVSREYLGRDRAFGIHLGVMMLEVRAGKRLREALQSLSERLGVEEAKTLATLFRQSEELGVSLSRALRTHSAEMRQMRMLRAEEKANALPVKMLLPLGAFIFPVTLVIVLVPVMIKLLDALKGMSPAGV